MNSDGPRVKVAPLRYDPDAEKKTIEAVKQLRKERDSHKVKELWRIAGDAPRN